MSNKPIPLILDFFRRRHAAGWEFTTTRAPAERCVPRKSPSMSIDENFNHFTKDANKMDAPTNMIGKRYRHRGNGHIYIVLNVAWLGDTDEWSIIHLRQEALDHLDHDFPVCVRTYRNFLGVRSNGDRRFDLVN